MSDNVVEQLENLNVKDSKKVSEMLANVFHFQLNYIFIDFNEYTCCVDRNISWRVKRGYDFCVNYRQVKGLCFFENLLNNSTLALMICHNLFVILILLGQQGEKGEECWQSCPKDCQTRA